MRKRICHLSLIQESYVVLSYWFFQTMFSSFFHVFKEDYFHVFLSYSIVWMYLSRALRLYVVSTHRLECICHVLRLYVVSTHRRNRSFWCHLTAIGDICRVQSMYACMCVCVCFTTSASRCVSSYLCTSDLVVNLQNQPK